MSLFFLVPGMDLSQSMGVTPVPNTSGPGCLNLMAVMPSGTRQPLPELALRIVGRASNAAVDFSLPPIMTDAQRMYISLFPTLLNQVL